ncbi:MAG: pyridoxal phosphate-dependent aminotransferase, partial [Alphaproteobacteria bacterium]
MSTPAPRPGIQGIDAYVPGRSSVAGLARVIKLSANESALGPSPRAVAAYREAADDIARYPDGASSRLREALGRHFGLDPAAIVCGNGSGDLINLIAQAYAGPGEEVIYSRHGFLLYPIAARAAGASPVAAKEENLRSSVEAILARVSPRTRIVFLANPNNPTGTYLTRDELSELRTRLREDVLLVIDAAYAEFSGAPDYAAGHTLVDGGANVVMTRSFSKFFALAGLRIGWA